LLLLLLLWATVETIRGELLGLLLLELHELLRIIAQVIALILSVIWWLRGLLLLIIKVLEVHELLSHHILHVLQIAHYLSILHLSILIGTKSSCLEVKVSLIVLELHCRHIHGLEILEGAHILHLHILEILIECWLLLHVLLRPLLLLRWLLRKLCDRRCLWAFHLVLLKSKSDNVDGHLG
jgi:hypothetical protein